MLKYRNIHAFFAPSCWVNSQNLAAEVQPAKTCSIINLHYVSKLEPFIFGSIYESNCMGNCSTESVLASIVGTQARSFISHGSQLRSRLLKRWKGYMAVERETIHFKRFSFSSGR